MPIGEAMFT
jgi:nitroreductase